jgi:hypothetical protein
MSDIRFVELETRKDVFVRISKIAAVQEIRPDGPSRILFDGGGHVDVCGAARIWRINIRLAELETGLQVEGSGVRG